MLTDYIEQLYDTFRDAVCVTDARGVVVLVNRRHSELTGIPKEDILGKRVQDMVQNGIFDVVLNAKVVNSGEKVASVQHLYNGRILILDGYPIKNDAGEVVYVVTIIRDITVLSELREEVTAQKELLETFQALNSDAAVPDAIQYPRVLQSQAMQRLYGEAADIARTDATVLLLGETGTGKDVMARHIHHLSGRADAPFIKVDCGSIPENLIETELFGYVPGSFSGASKNGKAGLVEAANGGTLFLDEVGELPMPMQTRLLRVLQDWEVLRVGATVPRKVDVRVIAATNKDLEKELERGSFRSDLYYRLKVAVLTLPPLRKRKADILPLAQGFLTYYGKRFHKKARLSEEVEHILRGYAWPGNVRELENLIQGLLVTCKGGYIQAADLAGIRPETPAPDTAPAPFRLPDIEGRSLKSIMKEVEAQVLEAGLRRYGSIGELARHFEMDRSTIFRKVRGLGGGAKPARRARKKRERSAEDDRP
ncbi:MAG: sigma 54-interacting transcriptional regulator [Desulfovibrio sp.]|uniref:sigma-54 interaction domain-containing protein n=1 Tax=Desulfovibrio sp. TaxID=885 RepID=UPI001A7B1824|nr:sigma 54-interacting transcriptional regulator [Desulfovibrio sp.]MBD5417306.1 sigma 54-interacting transcriptional regulator [Desulfovibrio sp.]